SKEYRPWRNQLENAFVVYGIKEIMTYRRFLGNYSTGYVRRDENYDTAGNHAHQYRWLTEFIMRVLAIIRTKLKGTALEIFNSEIGTINCYWKSNINGDQNIIAALKDTTDYPTNLNHQYNGAFDPIATTEGARCNPHITNATVQKGFREVFDNAFLVDTIQQIAQKDFWSFDFTKGLDYSNDNEMRNLINKYKKLMQIANWQWENNFYRGEYMFLLQRMPPAIMKHISSINPKPANRNEFFIAAENQFLAVRLTMSLAENLKEKKVIVPSHVTSVNNPVITEETVQNSKDNKTSTERYNNVKSSNQEGNSEERKRNNYQNQNNNKLYQNNNSYRNNNRKDRSDKYNNIKNNDEYDSEYDYEDTRINSIN
ncbi:46485_t:CDS:2, partial [Gigaspora margarita]